MVSLDGFGADYVKRFGAPHLEAIGAQGAMAREGMIPSYPSLTFPNHYTLVTGLYPEHHGIVGNKFYDPARGATYSYTDDATNHDGSWYGGVPLWSLVERQQMRAASLFWPGSEAKIAGERPSYYLHFDDHLDDEKRLDQVIVWLRLPPAERPHFISVYYSNVDHAGHDFGPESEQARSAVQHVDALMGELWERLRALKLPVDLIVVADHGMVTVQPPLVLLERRANLDGVTTVDDLIYPKSEAEAERIDRELSADSDGLYTVYRRAQVPAALHFDESAREGDPVVIATGPYKILARAPERKTPVGNHGFDPRLVPQMRALFVAAGPDIRPGVALAPFANVDVYPFVAKLLGLTAPKVDGTLRELAPALARKTGTR